LRGVREDSLHFFRYFFRGAIGSDSHGFVDTSDSKFHDGVILFLAKDDTDGWVLLREFYLFIQYVQVEIELTGVFGFEFSAFQFKDDEALQVAVEEQEVDEEFFAFHFEAVKVIPQKEVNWAVTDCLI
jgi:hypothetical protein